MSKVQSQSTKNDPVISEIPMACADEKAAVEFLEKQRWNGSACCPECGSVDVYQMMDSKNGERQKNFRWRCRDCKKQFTVRTATVFEDSRIPLRHWCFGFWRASTSKKGVSALEIHRATGISYKSCLFMLNRIRFAMSDSAPDTLGQNRAIVEVDETYVGGKPRKRNIDSTAPKQDGRKTWQKKNACVFAMVERGGAVKTKPIANVTGANVQAIMRSEIDKNARIATDDSALYNGSQSHFTSGVCSVVHSRREYARGPADRRVHTNTVEGFFSILKRGLNGIYHSVSKEHLHRYLSEYEFRYNHRAMTDGERTSSAIKAAEGKRLVYRQSVTA